MEAIDAETKKATEYQVTKMKANSTWSADSQKDAYQGQESRHSVEGNGAAHSLRKRMQKRSITLVPLQRQTPRGGTLTDGEKQKAQAAS